MANTRYNELKFLILFVHCLSSYLFVNQSRGASGAFVEFQVVILTNDENGFSSELNENRCKGLLKVSNRCMIYYIVKNIIEQKLKYITIVVNNKYYDDMVKCISEEFPDNYKFDDKKNKNSYCIDIEPYTTDSNDEIGSIQCLLQIRNKIKVTSQKRKKRKKRKK
ncbi:hypothetical protein [Plasmodium yoelii yoelii]|uniref:Uncharacterized protein n=1 Tax=Plasmodium yoelii yoelii TaxID=73239 RepID=Q7RCQ5_PLAYO|nr:hypothetical protein [Plasmodium yoelii yoelii]